MIQPGTKLIVYWHPPIASSTFEGDRLADGREQVEAIIRADLLRHYPDGRYKLKTQK